MLGIGNAFNSSGQRTAVAFVNMILNLKIPGMWATSLRVTNFSSNICDMDYLQSQNI